MGLSYGCQSTFEWQLILLNEMETGDTVICVHRQQTRVQAHPYIHTWADGCVRACVRACMKSCEIDTVSVIYLQVIDSTLLFNNPSPVSSRPLP